MKEQTLNTTDENRKTQILITATRLFATYGFKGVSIRQISEACGCNVASVSYHYGGKEKLYGECLKRLAPQTIQDFDLALSSPSTTEEFEAALREFCLTLSDFVIENSDAVKLLINEMNAAVIENKSSPETHFFKPLLNRMEHFFQESAEKGIIASDIDGRLLTRMIFSIIVTQMLYRSFKPFEEISNEALASKIIRICTGNIYV